MRIKAPRVSVVIPVYNQANYVSDAIQSVLDQTYPDYEVIVIDDGSTDDTRDVVAGFGDGIRYIWQKNLGLSAARNAGIKAARGEYIALLDSDDLYETDFLFTLLTTLEKTPRADAIYCVAQTVDVANHPLPQKIGKVVPPEDFYNTLLRGGFFPPSCMLAHKYCYENEGFLFDESLRRVEDLDLWLKMAQQYIVIGTDKVLLRYRIASKSLSTDPSIVLNHRIAVLNKQFNGGFSNNHQCSITREEALGRSYIAAACESIQLHDLKHANLYLYQAFNTSPELVADFEVFYDLSLGDQSRGFRGTPLNINVQRNARVLLALLNRLFNDPHISIWLKSHRNTAFANSYMALGFISFGTRQFRETKHYFFLSILNKPKYAFSSSLISTLIKSFLPVRFLEWLKLLRLNLATTALT